MDPCSHLEQRVGDLERVVEALVADRTWLLGVVAGLAVDLETGR